MPVCDWNSCKGRVWAKKAVDLELVYKGRAPQKGRLQASAPLASGPYLNVLHTLHLYLCTGRDSPAAVFSRASTGSKLGYLDIFNPVFPSLSSVDLLLS